MSIITVFLLALALGADGLSLCIGLGITGVRRAQIYIISGIIFLFHVLMPLIGLYLGQLAGDLLGRAAGIIGALIIIYLGAKTIYCTFRPPPETLEKNSFGIWGMIAMAMSVSMDALSVGFSLGTQQLSLLLVVSLFGFVAGIMAILGFYLGKTCGPCLGERANLAAGIILLGIGVKLLI